MRAKSEENKITFFGVAKEVFGNFTKSIALEREQQQLARTNNNGAEYPGYSIQNCANRAELHNKLGTLKSREHQTAISAVNNAHDRDKTPLHSAPKKALIRQATENQTYALPPFMPHANTQDQERRNAYAFFQAAKDPKHGEYAEKNTAGSLIHAGKSILEGAMVDLVGGGCSQMQVHFANSH